MIPEKFKKLIEVSKPIQTYLNDNFHPNMTVIITPQDVKVCEDVMFTNF